MSKRRGSHSKPDPDDPTGLGAQGAALEALMRDADALAKELGVEVGAAEPEKGPSGDTAAGQKNASSDPVAQVEEVERVLAGAAEEIGVEPREAGTSTGGPPPAEPSGSHVAGLEPSEWETTDSRVPTMEDDTVPVPGSAGSEDQPLSAAAGRPASARIPRSEGIQDAVESRARGGLHGMLGKPGVLGSVTARVVCLVKDSKRKLDLSSVELPVPVRAVFAWMDKPFRRVPWQARSAIGYMAILTLAMALITFAVGWFR